MDPEILRKKFKLAYHGKNLQNIFYDKKVSEKNVFLNVHMNMHTFVNTKK